MNDPEYVMRRIGLGSAPIPEEQGFGVFDIHFTNPKSERRGDWGQCLGVVFTDCVEIREHPEEPYAMWLKYTLDGAAVWRPAPFMRGTAADMPAMTSYLYNWALLGGYKETKP